MKQKNIPHKERVQYNNTNGKRPIERQTGMTVSKQPVSALQDQDLTQPSLADFSEMVARFYDGPLAQEPSWKGSLEAVRTFFRANYAVSITRIPTSPGRSRTTSHITYSGVQNVPDVNEFYNENFYAIDLFVNLPQDKAFTAQDFVSEEEWEQNAFYQQFLAPMDVFHVLGVDMCTADGGGCQIRICRPKSAANFSQLDKEYLELLVVHMKRCVELHAKQYETQSTNQLFASVIDRLMFGSVILDQYGFVLRQNKIAEDTIARKDGLSITSGKVHALMERDNKELQTLITNALAVHSGDQPNIVQALSISRPKGDCPLGILVRNVTAESWVEGDRKAAVAILFRDPLCAVETSHDAVRRLFGFTPAEAGLAMILADGKTLDDAAAELGVSMNTVRTHLKSMFLKTSTTRQTDLVRMILGSVATIC